MSSKIESNNNGNLIETHQQEGREGEVEGREREGKRATQQAKYRGYVWIFSVMTSHNGRMEIGRKGER